jgi:FAD/FMN-containing dehydrogenase
LNSKTAAVDDASYYATNHTHIDEFVETVRMITPAGRWEARRLPASGAGPDPNRLAIGSEGILGIITQAWMRIQARPRSRATASIAFPSWSDLVGMAGFEPAASCSQSRRANQAALHPGAAYWDRQDHASARAALRKCTGGSPRHGNLSGLSHAGRPSLPHGYLKQS